jgi:ABC-2 type transport system permease protein
MRTLMNNLRLFWQGALLSYIALFHWIEPVAFAASIVVSPLAQILFFTLLGTYATGQSNAQFFVIGNAMQLAAVSGIFGVVMSIGGDRWNGTLPYLFGTPANRIVMFFGRALVHVLTGILTVAIGFMWGVVLLRLDLGHTNLGLLALTILVTTLSTCGLGLLMGCIGLITVNVMFVNNTVYFLLLIFSGANIPPASLPGWMQLISNGLPLTRGIAAARALITGAGWQDVAPLLGGEILVGLFYGFLGYILFSWFETQAKRSGKLENV